MTTMASRIIFLKKIKGRWEKGTECDRSVLQRLVRGLPGKVKFEERPEWSEESSYVHWWWEQRWTAERETCSR